MYYIISSLCPMCAYRKISLFRVFLLLFFFAFELDLPTICQYLGVNMKRFSVVSVSFYLSLLLIVCMCDFIWYCVAICVDRAHYVWGRSKLHPVYLSVCQQKVMRNKRVKDTTKPHHRIWNIPICRTVRLMCVCRRWNWAKQCQRRTEYMQQFAEFGWCALYLHIFSELIV